MFFITVILILSGLGRLHAQSPDGGPWITVTMEPLSGKVKTEERDGSIVFVVPETPAHLEWLITYRIQNPSRRDTMQMVSLFDDLAPGLEIVDVTATYAPEMTPGRMEIWSDTTTHQHSFRWDVFQLKPGQWAQLVIKTGTAQMPAARRQYTGCNLYRLSQGILRFTLNDSSSLYERQGPVFQAEIPCPPYLEIRLNTKATWYIRMPGDYYARTVVGTVTANHPVEITFSGFADLKSASDDQTLPVFYALNEEQPQGWLTPEQLNATSLLLDDGVRTWSMWQRVVLDGQPAGIYRDTGVITFTLQNVNDALH